MAARKDSLDYEARWNPSICRSQSAIRFQPANILVASHHFVFATA
jgi:hypothetical protein